MEEAMGLTALTPLQIIRTARVAVFVMASVFMMPPPLAHANPITFQVTLSGSNENPANNSPGTGSATIVLDPTAQTLQLHVTFSGLGSNVMAAHIHCCQTTPNSNGNVGVATTVPAFLGFPIGGTSGTYTSPVFDLTMSSIYNPAFVTAQGGLQQAEAALISGIEGGQTYINIHTTNFPGGEIRAELPAVPDETLCSQANPTPPPCIPSAIVPLPGLALRAFDISWVDPTIHTYVLAASATVAGTGTGPSSNPRIIVVDTLTNKVVNEYNAKPTFAGSCPALPSGVNISGPNGVILIGGKTAGKNIKGEIWAGDGPIYTPSCSPGGTGVLTKTSSVKVLDLATGKTLKVIPTGGAGRADELCYNPASNVVLVANPASVDKFITFINAKSHKVLQQIKFDGTDSNSAPSGGSNINSNGIEQCQYNPRDGKFYLAIPATLIGPPPGLPGPGVVVRISAISPFHVEAAFTIPSATGCTGPQGLAVGPDSQIALGCGGANSLIINETTGSPIATVTGEGGSDEIWYNHGTNHYYFSRSGAAALAVEDAGPPPTQETPPHIATAAGSHSVAADSVKNEVYVPIRSNTVAVTPPATLPTVCSSFTGNTADDVQGCIAVYRDVGEIPPGSP
jgi:hypothetical protein